MMIKTQFNHSSFLSFFPLGHVLNQPRDSRWILSGRTEHGLVAGQCCVLHVCIKHIYASVCASTSVYFILKYKVYLL